MRPCACQPVLVPCSFFLLPDFTSGLLWLSELALLPLEAGAGVPAGRRTLASRPPSHYAMCRHPQGLHPAHGCYLWGEPGVNKYDDPVASHDKPLRCLPRPQRHGAASDTVSRHLVHDTCRGEGTPPARSTRCAPRAV